MTTKTERLAKSKARVGDQRSQSLVSNTQKLEITRELALRKIATQS